MIAPTDPQALFAAAERAFVAGRLEESRTLLLRLQPLIEPAAAVSNLLGLVERRRGNAPAAVAALEQAARLDPNDPQIWNNLANALGDAGRSEPAFEAYDRAAHLRAGWPEPTINKAVLLQTIGRPAAAKRLLDTLSPPHDIRATLALASIDMELGNYSAASTRYDRILTADPNHVRAREGQARAALELGDADAVERYLALAQESPHDLTLRLGLAEALEAEGSTDGEMVLAATVAANPEWVEGQVSLARMRAEMGDPAYDRTLRAATEQRPGVLSLWEAHIATLTSADRAVEAIDVAAAARKAIGDPPELLTLEANAAIEARQLPRAADVLTRLDRSANRADAALAAKLALASGRPEEAAALIEAVDTAARGVLHWALLTLAWRVLDDPRHVWLSGQPGLSRAIDLDLTRDQLDEMARLLRQLHTARAHPPGQSLRGGTQTRGRLLARREPALRSLADRLTQAVADYRASLPPADSEHPLLAWRDTPLRITGSWSIRLSGAGFHVPHIHTAGVLSSACYITLPRFADDPEPQAGWLEIGGAPPVLGLDLPPLGQIEPAPGRLALFPSYLYHGTRPFTQGERLTVAFDAMPPSA